MLNLNLVQAYMQEDNLDAWLISDFRGNNPVMSQVIGEDKETTRRTFLLIPDRGEPKLLIHIFDKFLFSDISFSVDVYIGWEDLRRKLKRFLEDYNRVAMEYSPGAAIPMISRVDGGTLDLIRSYGKDICSSGDIYQIAVATWSRTAFNSHIKACKELIEIKDAAFSYIRQTIREKKLLTEYDVQEFIMNEFHQRGLETEDRPTVAVNQNSGNLHYEPTMQLNSQINKGDWILLDLWARYPGAHNVFADITWVGYIGNDIPIEYLNVFEIVKNARDLVIKRLRQAWEFGERLQGWQLDMVARNAIQNAGYGNYFIHRTGHSIGPGLSVHALGVNLDNLDTHDVRSIIPGIGFSIEPGIYLSDFGVRSEINVFIDPEKGPLVTTPLQTEVTKLA
jgi:Xaa-Pro dipeptidase